MPSKGWNALGGSSVLGYLRPDLAQARELLLIGPWLDAHVAEAILSALPAFARVRALTRPYGAMDIAFVPHARAAHEVVLNRNAAQVRVLANLHAKVIIIDEVIAYCGSANWYRYSLESSREIVLRGDANEASGLLDLAEGLWQAGTPLGENTNPLKPAAAAEQSLARAGYQDEALDPIAASVLKDVRGAFVLSKKTR